MPRKRQRRINFELIGVKAKARPPKPTARTSRLSAPRLNIVNGRYVLRGTFPVQLETQEKILEKIRKITIIQGSKSVVVYLHLVDGTVQKL
ncbi:MAG: hypothetical protein ACTSWA_05275 [Candidatus Thorarchaeota archaeon]